jgi:molybdenum cofactor biosynthesis enzyme MoaA
MVRATRLWLEGEYCLNDVREVAATLPRRRHISMVVNNECNLHCTHCFLQLPALAKQRLTVGEWQRVLETSIPEDIGQYVIAGKEAFVGKTGPEIISWLGQLRRQRPCIRTGIVTNGTLLHAHQDLVRNADFSHMDISMDGCEADHDFIRGPGAFAKIRDNVRWAADLLGERLFITLTLQNRNIERIGEAIQSFAELGARSVGISPFEKLPYNDHSLALTTEQIAHFLGNLRHIERLALPHTMFIQADACVVEPMALLAFMESEWFDLDAMQIDGTGFLYCRHQLNNGITLSFRFLPWPMTLDSSVRISADGELISVDDARHPRAYHLNRLANVRDFDFDFGAAFSAAKRHPRLALQDSVFETELQPLIRAAYRRHLAATSAVRFAAAS